MSVRYQSRLRPDSARQAGSAALAGLAGAATGVIIVLLAWLIVRTESAEPGAVPSTPPSSPPAPVRAAAPPAASRPAPSATRTVKPAAPLGDVRDQRAGLFCRDLRAKGFSYTAAIDYWRYNGQPNQMDADRNGIPCETVYPRADVRSYWGGRDLPALSAPAGLFCRDLAARGFSYPEAVAYWWTMSQPSRMDADRNGIPCETVYAAADVTRFWYG